jgi:putative endonuclease
MTGYLYILASRPRGAVYVGVTSDLVRRIHEHREGAADGFTKRYGVKRLVYFETFTDIRTAIQRERNLKHWIRQWKLALVEKANPDWRDLFAEIVR